MVDTITSSSAPGPRIPPGATRILREVPPPPKIGTAELEHAERWLMARGLLWHPRALPLSPVARVGLARLATANGAWARRLLDNPALASTSYFMGRRRDGLELALELLETLVRRNVGVAGYFKHRGLLDVDRATLLGNLEEMLYTAWIAEAEGKRGYSVAARVVRNFPWSELPNAYIAFLRRRYPDFPRLIMQYGAVETAVEIDAVVGGDSLVEIKRRGQGRKVLMPGDILSDGDYQHFFHPAKLLAVARQQRLRGVEFALSLEEMDTEWSGTIAQLAETMGVGVRLLHFPLDSNEGAVVLDTMRPQAVRGAAILFPKPMLPPVPEQQAGLLPEDRAWLAQWIPDPVVRAKAAMKSRYFFREALPQFAGAIAERIAKAVMTHYEEMALYESFDPERQREFVRQAAFLAEKAGPGSPPEIIEMLVAFGRRVRELTADDLAIARGLAGLADTKLRTIGEIKQLGISAEGIARIEGFVRKRIAADLQSRYLVEFPGTETPVQLFNLFALLRYRRSELPDDLAREIERALPEWRRWLGELSSRFGELSEAYKALPWEARRGRVKTRRQRIPDFLERVRRDGCGDLGLIEAKIDELDEDLARLGVRARSFSGVETEATPAEEAVDAEAQAAEATVVTVAGTANNPDASASTIASPSSAAPTSVVRPVR